MASSPGMVLWDYTFRISPIFLTNGIAGTLPGAALSIVSLLQPTLFVPFIDTGPGDLTLDNFFAHFMPLPGATLVQQDIGRYPFANQAVAANAVIRDPLVVSMLMECSVRPPNTYMQKFSIMQALKAALDQHNNSGGTYTVMTPSFPYTDGILRRFQALPSQGEQPQNVWQWDFEFPLITLQAATQAYNNLMGKIANGTPLTTNSAGQVTWSSLQTTVGGDTSGSSGFTAWWGGQGFVNNPIASGSGGPISQGNFGADQSAGSFNTSPSGSQQS